MWYCGDVWLVLVRWCGWLVMYVEDGGGEEGGGRGRKREEKQVG